MPYVGALHQTCSYGFDQTSSYGFDKTSSYGFDKSLNELLLKPKLVTFSIVDVIGYYAGQ